MLLRLAALDLVGAMLEAVASPVSRCDDQHTRERAETLAARIGQHRAAAFRLTVGGEYLDLSGDDKASGRYARQVAAMRAEISAGWGATVDATAFIAAVLALVGEADEQLPRTMAYLEHRAEWGALHSLLAELYEIFDPEYTDAAGIEHGARVGERMVPA